jgi:hypothetical protein
LRLLTATKLFIKKSVLLNRHYVLIAERRDDWLGATKERSTRENATFASKRLCQCMRRTGKKQFTVINVGGLTLGTRWITAKIMIRIEVFSNS